MFRETVKVVNGYRIERMPGTRKSYWVEIKHGDTWSQKRHFTTIKAAETFIISSL